MIHKNWQELIKPTQLDIKPGADPLRMATIVAEPLERGFGGVVHEIAVGLLLKSSIRVLEEGW